MANTIKFRGKEINLSELTDEQLDELKTLMELDKKVKKEGDKEFPSTLEFKYGIKSNKASGGKVYSKTQPRKVNYVD